jgi:hypothetical protein
MAEVAQPLAETQARRLTYCGGEFDQSISESSLLNIMWIILIL